MSGNVNVHITQQRGHVDRLCFIADRDQDHRIGAAVFSVFTGIVSDQQHIDHALLL